MSHMPDNFLQVIVTPIKINNSIVNNKIELCSYYNETIQKGHYCKSSSERLSRNNSKHKSWKIILQFILKEWKRKKHHGVCGEGNMTATEVWNPSDLFVKFPTCSRDRGQTKHLHLQTEPFLRIGYILSSWCPKGHPWEPTNNPSYC